MVPPISTVHQPSPHLRSEEKPVEGVPNKNKSSFPSSKHNLTRIVSGKEVLECRRCTFLNHPALSNCEICGEKLQEMPISEDSPSSSQKHLLPKEVSIIDKGPSFIKLSFREGGEVTFFTRLQKALEEGKWQKIAQGMNSIGLKTDLKDFQVTNNSGGGITGLERASEAILSHNDLTLGASFDDLTALMTRAQELIKLSESLASRLASGNTVSSSSNAARDALRRSTQVLGLTSPAITREIAGDKDTFHNELAKELSDFLQDGLLRREGGMITLIDLFAFYNRARGTGIPSKKNLISK